MAYSDLRLPSAESWSDFALFYERLAEPHTHRFALDALRLAGPPAPGERVLDVAAGTGALTLPALETGAEVHAIDFSPAMVARLRQRAAAVDPDGALRIKVMDGTALAYPDDRFDAAFSIFGVMLFPDPGAGLREMRRVVRPGGRVATAVWGSAEGAAPIVLFHQALRAAFPGRAIPPAFPAMLPLTTEDGLAAALDEAGLTDIRIERVTHPWRFKHQTELADEADAFFAHTRLWTELDQAERERVKHWLRDNGVAEMDSVALVAVARVPG